MQLSQDEEEVFFDVEIIRKKRIISGKIFDDLSEFKNKVSALLQNTHKEHFISQYTENYPKISRGENYKGLPYFMFDYPRVFNPQNTFAIRTMVYWGNFYSFTLQVAGENQIFLAEKILTDIQSFSDFYCCVNETPWEHHYNSDNFQLIRSLDEIELKKILLKKTFFKLSIPYKLSDYQNLHQNGLLFYKKIISLLN